MVNFGLIGWTAEPLRDLNGISNPLKEFFLVPFDGQSHPETL